MGLLDELSIGNAASRFGVPVEDDPQRMDLNDFTVGNLVSRFDPNGTVEQGNGGPAFDSSDWEVDNIADSDPDPDGTNSGGTSANPLQILARFAELILSNLQIVIYGGLALVVIHLIGSLFEINIGDSTQ